MFSRIVLSVCAGLIAVSPAFALPMSEAGTNSVRKNETPKSKVPNSQENNVEADVKEREHLTKLWEAALVRSEDLQFVTQKIMGREAKGSSLWQAVNHVSSAGSGVWAIADRDDPGYPSRFVSVSDCGDPRFTSCGYSCLRRWSKNGHRPSQTEAIMLFGMVQKVVDGLRSAYIDYKKAHSQKMATAKSEKEHDTKQNNQLSLSRKKLVALAGEAAVSELDKDLDNESKTSSEL